MIAQTKTTAAHRWTAVDWLPAILVWIVAAELWITGIGSIVLAYAPAWDFLEHRAAAERWLATGSPYWPWELAPFDVWGQAREPIMYPPTFLYLAAPFTVLPAVLWWAIPIAITAWIVWRYRSPARLACVAGLVANPFTLTLVWYGNPGMWIVAILALAVRWPAFGPFVLVKPSLFPFALVGFGSRAWWIGLAALAVLSVPFGTLWIDWIRVLLNSRQEAGLLYSAWGVAPLLIPLCAWRGPSLIVNGWRRLLRRRQITMRITPSRQAARGAPRTSQEQPAPR